MDVSAIPDPFLKKYCIHAIAAKKTKKTQVPRGLLTL
jgi:hypothetical protein